jgi:hypothetical protein
MECVYLLAGVQSVEEFGAPSGSGACVPPGGGGDPLHAGCRCACEPPRGSGKTIAWVGIGEKPAWDRAKKSDPTGIDYSYYLILKFYRSVSGY